MTTIPYSSSAAPDLPPLPIGALVACALDLMRETGDLPQPRYITIHQSTQAIGLQFAKSAASYRALAGWAQRFGAVVASEDRNDPQGQPCRYVRVTFDWFGVEVQAYAYIPVTETGS